MKAKNINYTSDNLFDIKNLRHRVFEQIEEYQIQQRILDGKIFELCNFRDALDRHIDSIEKQNKEESND